MKLTLREKEIYEALKRDPLVSQDELAKRFGITRSSVAVHISNLMKKGVILGKGYVFNEAVSAVVVGEACININIQGENEKSTIDIVYGGFALELSRALANYGVNVKVITVAGNDDIGEEIISKLKERNIDTSNIYRHLKARSCRRVLLNHIVSYNETYNWKEYEKAISLREWVTLNCEWLCIDPHFQGQFLTHLTGKDEEVLPYLSTYREIRYPEEVPEFLRNYSTLVLGVETEHFDYYINKIKSWASNQYWLITDGVSRVVYFQDLKAVDVLLLPNQSFDIRNRLPFLLAGLIYGLSNGYPLRQAIRIGIGSAVGE